MSEVLTPIAYQLGVGGILGFVVGYAVKKLAKIVAVLAGVLAFVLIYLGYEGVININYSKLAEMIGRVMGIAGQASGFITAVIASLPFVGSFLAGAVLGLKLG